MKVTAPIEIKHWVDLVLAQHHYHQLLKALEEILSEHVEVEGLTHDDDQLEHPALVHYKQRIRRLLLMATNPPSESDCLDPTMPLINASGPGHSYMSSYLTGGNRVVS